jgi:hypothetical protein
LLTRKITSIINKTNNVNFIVCFTPLLSIPRENDSIIPLILLSNVNTFSNPCSENESIRLDRPFDKDIKVFYIQILYFLAILVIAVPMVIKYYSTILLLLLYYY